MGYLRQEPLGSALGTGPFTREADPDARRRPDGGYRLEELHSVDALEAHACELQALVDAGVEDNAYMAPAFLVPLLRAHGSKHPLRIVLVWQDQTLVACAPLSMLRPTRRTPLPAISTALTPHGRILHPLVHRDHAAEALRVLWDWLCEPSHPWRVVLLEYLSTTSPFWSLLEKELRMRGSALWVRETHTRPMLERRASFEAYLSELPSSRRKGYRRRLRALEKSGRVEFILHRDRADCPDLAQRFMDLERQSWKGESGTAMALIAHDRAFFEHAVAAFAAERRLFFVEVRVDGTPIAMTSNFVQGRTLFAFKVAYRADYAQFSPGILAEMEGIKRFYNEPSLLRIDSGSGPDTYVRGYFRDAAEMQLVCVATPRVSARAFVRLMPTAIRLKNLARSVLAPSSAPEGAASPDLDQASDESGLSRPSKDGLPKQSDEVP